jgi:hypothetical protein
VTRSDLHRRAHAIATFLLDFVVGDDWRVGAGVVAAVVLTWLLHLAGVAAWWCLPVAVLALLAASVRRAARHP